MNEISSKFHQVRGEIVHEFSVLEYHGRSYLAGLLETEAQKALSKYKEQFKRYCGIISKEEITLNERALENPDVRRMGAELVAAEVPSFDNCLDQLVAVGKEIDFARMTLLRPLVKEIKSATRERNTLTHGVWHEVGDKIVVLTFPEYHKHKWMLIKGDDKRLAPQRSPEWTFEGLKRFAVLGQRLLPSKRTVVNSLKPNNLLKSVIGALDDGSL